MIFRFISCFVMLVSFLAPPARSQDSNHIQWVAESLQTMQSVKVGMTRDQLNDIFINDGGISTPGSQTFVYRKCSYFKVDVEFDVKAGEEPKGTDKIVHISRPYLEEPATTD